MANNSEKWFTQYFRDPEYLTTWRELNDMKIATRIIPNEDMILESKPIPNKRDINEDVPKSKPVPNKRVRAAALVQKPTKKQAVKESEDEVSSDKEDTTTEDDTQKEEPSVLIVDKSKNPLEIEKNWWFAEDGPHQRKLKPSYICKDMRNLCVMFQGRYILYFKTLYYLRKLPDGSAVGDAKICQRVKNYFCMSCNKPHHC